jgi:hypothetical protein
MLNDALHQGDDGQFHFYNSLVLTNDTWEKYPKKNPRLYTPDAATNDDELPLQTRSNDQNNVMLKIDILIMSNASTQEIPQAIIDSGESCCVTPHLEDFLNRPTPIKTQPYNDYLEDSRL